MLKSLYPKNLKIHKRVLSQVYKKNQNEEREKIKDIKINKVEIEIVIGIRLPEKLKLA